MNHSLVVESLIESLVLSRLDSKAPVCAGSSISRLV